jgi:hypothetical protein
MGTSDPFVKVTQVGCVLKTVSSELIIVVNWSLGISGMKFKRTTL